MILKYETFNDWLIVALKYYDDIFMILNAKYVLEFKILSRHEIIESLDDVLLSFQTKNIENLNDFETPRHIRNTIKKLTEFRIKDIIRKKQKRNKFIIHKHYINDILIKENIDILDDSCNCYTLNEILGAITSTINLSKKEILILKNKLSKNAYKTKDISKITGYSITDIDVTFFRILKKIKNNSNEIIEKLQKKQSIKT